MNRRNAIKKFLIASGGWITLPFWMTACRMTDKPVHFSSFSLEEQTTLAAIADTIIPAAGGDANGHTGAVGGDANGGSAVGAGIGALSVGVDKFLQKLIDDCYEKPVQDNVKKQLAELEDSAKKQYGKSFATASPQQRQEMLLKRLSSVSKEEKDCFVLLKNETIRGFTTSQQVMEEYLHYKVAPGHYYGNINLKS